jgi:uncharacterized protein (AIM24 family)
MNSFNPPVLSGNTMHVIDYKVHGDDMQFVEIELDPNEAVVAEAGGMMFMDDGIAMETIFGDGSNQNRGFVGALLGAGKRLLTGESLFMTVFQNQGTGKRRVAFGAPYPGKILPIPLASIGGELIAQKDSFLCAAKGVSVSIAFQKKLGAGLFGGEGFIMQRLQGDGWAFIHAGGTLYERTLAPGETLRVDTGCIVAFQPSRPCAVPVKSGSNHCPSPVSPAASSAPPAAGERKAPPSAASAASSTATTAERRKTGRSL